LRVKEKAGTCQIIFNTLAIDEDTEWLMVDSTIIRAHERAAGVEAGRQEQELGRLKEGLGANCALLVMHLAIQ
jgi:hypothetical protein